MMEEEDEDEDEEEDEDEDEDEDEHEHEQEDEDEYEHKCDDDIVRYFLSQIENGHKSDSETHRRRDKPDTRATENWLETNNYD